ncbi:NmrA family domain-containing protein 1 [Trichoderma lentiforme]|uniref:NmrA family domain-containing protein 1 n=1 Tax=Trichoderma lentiforme TaxID=1567552 RepID=A0A9P4XBP2_9HYPO|nr:NmrA family domain-containing protein 1 [Trichoderma lentiforme]
MSSRKPIVVVGATGNQGGSVGNMFSSEPGWRVRALTRNTPSTKAQDLGSSGVEVVRANIDDLSTLTAAFDGPELGTSPELRDAESYYPSHDLQ